MTDYKVGDKIKVRMAKEPKPHTGRFLDVENLTFGRVYEGVVLVPNRSPRCGAGIRIENDIGTVLRTNLRHTAHLDYEDWEVVTDD